MFKMMRRFKQELNEEECIEIINNNTSGVLSLFDGEYPYGVPLSYAYYNNSIYFHSAVEGHKIEAIKKCKNASFTIIDKDEIVPNKLTTYFRSVILFGNVKIVEAEEEVVEALKIICDKYAKNESIDLINNEISSSLKKVKIIKFDIEKLSGKEARELMEKKKTS